MTRLQCSEPLSTILHTLHQEVFEREKRIDALERDHKQYAMEVSLRLNAEFLYSHSYGFDVGNTKDVILLALKSNKVPQRMQSEAFQLNFPSRIVNDRDILLARLELPDFESFHANNAFIVPKKLRKNKEVMIAVCSKCPESLQFASKELKDDPDVVLAAVQSKVDKAPLAIQHASKRMKGDKKIVRTALSRNQGIQCLLYIAPKLLDDKKLILRSILCSSNEIHQAFEVLSVLPKSQRKDASVVRAAVTKRGSNLRFASKHLRKQMEICEPACKQDGNAFQYVLPGQTQSWLLERKYLRMILKNGGGRMFKYAPLHLQNDKMLLLLAVKNGLGSIGGFENLWKADPQFCLKLLRINGKLYESVPDFLLDNTDIIEACVSSKNIDTAIVAGILENASSVQANRKLMMRLARQNTTYTSLIAKAYPAVRESKSFMMAVCSVGGANFSIASSKLQRDPDVVVAAVTSESPGEVVFDIPREYLDDPDVIEKAIEHYNGKNYYHLSKHLPAVAFQSRRVLMAWFQKGWPHIPDLVSMNMVADAGYLDDDEVMIAILRYDEDRLLKFTSDRRFNRLLQSREFLGKALKQHVEGRLLHYSSFRFDYDLLLCAVASSPMVLQVYHGKYSCDMKELCNFAVCVRQRLSLTDKVFFSTFLCGIAISRRVAPVLRSSLPILDRGDDIKRLIAEYTGIPLGEELQTLRAASENLAIWGY